MHLCAPDKHTVYSKQFPIPILFSIADFYYEKTNKSFLYPKEILQSLLPQRVYRRVDTHWSLLGCAAVASLIAEKFGVTANNNTLQLEKLKTFIKESNTTSAGDLGSKLSPPHREANESFEPDWQIKLFDNGLNKGNDGMMRVAISENPLAYGRLLIFGDSYSFQILEMLTLFFKEIIVCRTKYYHKEMVQICRPNFIMTQNVERYFSNISADEEAPPFFLVPQLLERQTNMSKEAAEAFAYIMTEQPSRFAHAVKLGLT